MKKWTSLALLGLTSATLLVACGSKKGGEQFFCKRNTDFYEIWSEKNKSVF